MIKIASAVTLFVAAGALLVGGLPFVSASTGYYEQEWNSPGTGTYEAQPDCTAYTGYNNTARAYGPHAVDAQGNLYALACWGGDALIRIDAAGAEHEFVSSSALATILGQFGATSYIDVGLEATAVNPVTGDVYAKVIARDDSFQATGAAFLVFSQNGTYKGANGTPQIISAHPEIAATIDTGSFSHLQFDNQGNAFVTGRVDGLRVVYKFLQNGTIEILYSESAADTSRPAECGANAVEVINSASVNPVTGDYYMIGSCPGLYILYRFDNNGAVVGTFLSTNLSPEATFRNETMLAFDKSGNAYALFANDTYENVFAVFSPTGQLARAFAVQGAMSSSGFLGSSVVAYGMAVDNAGRIVIPVSQFVSLDETIRSVFVYSIADGSLLDEITFDDVDLSGVDPSYLDGSSEQTYINSELGWAVDPRTGRLFVMTARAWEDEFSSVVSAFMPPANPDVDPTPQPDSDTPGVPNTGRQ